MGFYGEYQNLTSSLDITCPCLGHSVGNMYLQFHKPAVYSGEQASWVLSRLGLLVTHWMCGNHSACSRASTLNPKAYNGCRNIR